MQHDLGKIEHLVRQKMQLLGQGLLQRLIDKTANGYKGSYIPCRCGGWMRFVQHRDRDIHTLFGWIRLKRAYYHCPDCGAGMTPYDHDSGLGSEQLSPGLVEACCMLTVDDSFEQTAGRIERLYGQKVSDNTVERVVHQVGAVALQQQDRLFFEHRQISASEFKPGRLYIAADGTTVHERDGWHQAKSAGIYYEDERLGTVIKRYVAGFDNSARFGWLLWLEACRCGLYQAQEVVYLRLLTKLHGFPPIRLRSGQAFRGNDRGREQVLLELLR